MLLLLNFFKHLRNIQTKRPSVIKKKNSKLFVAGNIANWNNPFCETVYNVYKSQGRSVPFDSVILLVKVYLKELSRTLRKKTVKNWSLQRYY